MDKCTDLTCTLLTKLLESKELRDSLGPDVKERLLKNQVTVKMPTWNAHVSLSFRLDSSVEYKKIVEERDEESMEVAH